MEPDPEPSPFPRGLALVAVAALGLWLWVTVPLATGTRTLYFRDVFTTHVPWKAFGAAELRHGRIPAFNPSWALGQPFRGDPNALPFYPGNFLYLLLPFWSAFNLHYALHWLLAAVAMAALARGLGQGRAAALVAGITYAGSGWILTALSFYNILAVAAWWPLVLLGAARGGRRGVALGGIACGLALLAGEPVTASLGLLPLLLVAIQRHGWRRGFLTSAGIGAVGLLLALPQVVATARILGFTARQAGGMGGGRFHLGAARLLELVVPFPFGRPWELGRTGYWPWDDQPGLPYVVTLYFGIVALWLAILGARGAKRARSWTALAVAGIVLAWAGAFGGDALAAVSRGLARYPEKLLFWFALATPLLAGWGLERALASPRAWRGAAAAAGLALAAAVGVFAAGPRLAAWLAAGRVAPDQIADAPRARLGMWIVTLVLAGAFLALAAVAARLGSAAGLAAAVLAALLPMAGLVMTAPVADFVPSAWGGLVGPGSEMVNSNLTAPLGESSGNPLSDPSYLTLVRLAAFDLGPAPGVLHGVSYPLAQNLDGLYSPLSALVLLHLPSLDWDARANWFRVLGVEAALLEETPQTPRLRLRLTQQRFGAPSHLFTVEDPAPVAFWPRSVRAAAHPADAFRAVSVAADPVADAVTDRPVPHVPGAKVRVVSDKPDRCEVEVSGSGGLLVLRRAYQPLYRATAEGKRLQTLAVDLALLGVQVPPGKHRVEVAVSAGPEKAAGIVAFLALLGTLGLAWKGR
jgi:hypothetical protein